MPVNRKRIVYPLLFAAIIILTAGSSVHEGYETNIRRIRSRESGSATLKMIFAGDIMAHEVNYTREPYDAIYQGIRDLVWDADLSFANLEFVFDPGL